MTVLNEAKKIAIGNKLATAVYVGSTKVWPTFRPIDLAGCMVWMDASKLALANGAAVSSWTNLGAGSQPSMTAGATYRANALNGNGVVRITRGSGKLRWYSGTGVDKNYTIVYVGRRWQNTAGRIVAAFGTTSNTLIGFHGNEMDQCYTEGWITSGVSPLSSTQWKIYSADATASAPSRLFSNGSLISSVSVIPALGWGGTLCISGYLDNADVAASQESDCEIAELVMYNRKLSDAERVQVEDYLRKKWNPITAFVPTDYGANIVAWFDGMDEPSVTITEKGVSNWRNKGVGAMTLNQTVTAQRPKFTANAVSFAQGTILTPASGPASYDAVWLGVSHASTADWRTLLRSAQGHEVIMEAGSTRFGVYATAAFQPAGSYTWPAGAAGIGFTRVAASAVNTMSRDGGALASTTTALAAGNFQPIMFGGYASAPPSQAWGNVNEIIFTPYNLDGARQLLEGYLAHRWGMTSLLPVGHPYKSIKP